jgi:two-component system copper resistance phosphate regulon response regulator CusR
MMYDKHAQSMKPRLLVVEKETKAAASTRAGLIAEGYRVDVAANADEALRLAELLQYDAIILDVTMPSTAGLSVVRQLRRCGVASPVVVLSGPGEVEDRVRGLDAGADDYLAKPVPMAELLARLRALLRRRHPQSGNILRVADLELDRVTHEVVRAGERIELTRLEFALLEMLMNASPRPVNKARIIEQVWQRRLDSQTNVVNVYVRNLRRKLGGKHCQPLLHTVRGVGFCCRGLF